MKKYSILKKSSILIVVLFFLPLSFASLVSQNEHDLFQKALTKERAEGNLKEAISLYEKVIEMTKDESLAAQAQLRIGFCYEKLGMKEAQKAFQKVVDNYPKQAQAVEAAKEKLSILLKAQSLVEKGDKEFKIRKIWEGPDFGYGGAISPDGKYISYTGYHGNLAVWEIETGKKRLLTDSDGSAWVNYSIFSPDGKQIAFDWQLWDTELRIIGLDGSNPRTLARNKWIQPTDWSPDGNHILALVTGADGRNQIALVSVSDGATRILKTFGVQYPERMSFSPDGRYVAYDFPQQADSKDRDIFLLAKDGSRETRLIDHPANDSMIGWTPDGKNLLFLSNRTGSAGLWIIQVADGQPLGQPELIKQDIGSIHPVGLTKKGAFFYGTSTKMENVHVANIEPKTYKVIGNPTPLSQRMVVTNFAPDWSPDGKFLAYRSERLSGPTGSRSVVISIRSLDTGEERELSPAVGGFYLIKWSPDGQSFLLGGGLCIVDAQTGKITAMVPNGYWGSWSPDGKTIFYAKNDVSTKSRPLVARDLKSGEDKVLVSGFVGFGAAVSPDGGQIAFTSISGENYVFSTLYVLSLKEDKRREIFKLKNPEDFGPIAWSPDGSRLLFVRRNFKENKFEIWQIPVEGGQPQNLRLSTTAVSPISIHPDGKRIAYSFGQPKAEIWVMENFLPKTKEKK